MRDVSHKSETGREIKYLDSIIVRAFIIYKCCCFYLFMSTSKLK